MDNNLNRHERLEHYKTKIMECITGDTFISEIIELSGFSASTVCRILTLLVNDGEVSKVRLKGSNGKFGYSLTGEKRKKIENIFITFHKVPRVESKQNWHCYG